ncbi:5'-deoxynucleotidase [Olsenella sp. KH3B4]|uniref:5'-deoxynucleotidase n=1 Tax=Olsenella sp. KH3B4 TaxID=1855394 RepID=UPI0008BDB4D9|nr:5'-deoxynucleotidase [Olsenella sp. KH3B4]SES71427.1 5'-deoxynucleotidase [Olsenella sp. KH3B4]
MAEQSTFFAIVSRMKYIERWALMRNARPENLSEHSLEVAAIAHGLATLGNVRYGRHLDAEKAALIGLFHDTTEIVTGDMPTPVKYANRGIRDAYKDVEHGAEDTLLDTLPADLRPTYEAIFRGNPADADDVYLRRLVKAADKISALIKCVDEAQSGNAEFKTAEKGIRTKVDEMASQLPEVADFVEEFLPSYGKTLDQLL